MNSNKKYNLVHYQWIIDIEFTFFVQKGWTGMNLDRLALSAWKHDQSRFDPSNKIKIFDNRWYRTVLEYGFYGPLNPKCVCKILKKLLEYDAPVSQGNQSSWWLIGAFNRAFISLYDGGPWIPGGQVWWAHGEPGKLPEECWWWGPHGNDNQYFSIVNYPRAIKLCLKLRFE